MVTDSAAFPIGADVKRPDGIEAFIEGLPSDDTRSLGWTIFPERTPRYALLAARREAGRLCHKLASDDESSGMESQADEVSRLRIETVSSFPEPTAAPITAGANEVLGDSEVSAVQQQLAPLPPCSNAPARLLHRRSGRTSPQPLDAAMLATQVGEPASPLLLKPPKSPKKSGQRPHGRIVTGSSDETTSPTSSKCAVLPVPASPRVPASTASAAGSPLLGMVLSGQEATLAQPQEPMSPSLLEPPKSPKKAGQRLLGRIGVGSSDEPTSPALPKCAVLQVPTSPRVVIFDGLSGIEQREGSRCATPRTKSAIALELGWSASPRSALPSHEAASPDRSARGDSRGKKDHVQTLLPAIPAGPRLGNPSGSRRGEHVAAALTSASGAP